MNAYKQFLTSDIIVSPFEVNKAFSFKQSEWGTDVQVDKFIGTSGSFEFNKDTTGVLNTEYQVLVYNSVKELYYSNFLTQSYGDIVSTASLVPGETPDGDILVGSTNSTGRYFNYLQSTLTASRYFPTGSGAQVGVVSVSSKLFGNYIQPYSFIFDYSSSFKAYDDGEGNLYSSASFSWDTGIFTYYSESLDFKIYQDTTTIFIDVPVSLPDNFTFISASWLGDSSNSPFRDVGTGDPVQEIDNQGITFDNNTGEIISDASVWDFADPGVDVGPILVTWISDSSIINSVSANENVGNIIYPHGMAIFTNQNLPLSSITTLANTTCSFSSSLEIYETQYKCTIRENEFNFSLNPSLISGSTDGTAYGYVTSSYFSPFVTTVGLYDEFQNLLAVGKLAQPLPTTATTDTTILINLDR
jgi:hypothetical protein